MNRFRFLKYTAVFTLPLVAYVSFTNNGWLTYLPLLEAFFLIPLLELFINPKEENLSKAEKELVKNDKIYDFLLYLVVPIQYTLMLIFLFSMADELLWWERFGRILGFGIVCGVLGINVAHELGHRKTGMERTFAKALLATSLYMHFYIEHNRGHHKNVGTPDDPASSRLNETLYAFWLRSIVYSYISAWKIENARMKKNGKSAFSFSNEMLRFQLIQILMIAVIAYFLGPLTAAYFVAGAIIGFLLLETVNYIEHYGLSRQKVKDDRYELVRPVHSWNSNHVLGRLVLFELSRHSDHHHIASKKYQTLDHHDESPQMPTGYPGMMLLSTIPPLWFRIMNKRIKDYQIGKA